MQTKYDLTFMNGFLTIGLCVLLGVGLVRMIWPSLPGGDLLMSGGGAIIFSGYILVDTQLLVGNGEVQLSPDDYIGAALNIYLDIINLFMSILQLLAASQDNSS
ncbi:inhibitor of apoptosis-promotor [Gregarina niphandrodes]|nr:inhibitor of apoptosis-promotor [Gregarina niphandrodes]EZG48572.1 inhibitor of apoptosis-promotor [Gregarina niphandrodes]|eukprot:XP_011132093.1 inhibitor of apoptosis-promotor [Gregarina niphandrodes]